MLQAAILALGVLAAPLAKAATPFLNEPDTGLEDFLFSTNYTPSTLPPLRDMRGIPDFDWAARQALPMVQYSYYRTAAAGEWSYRNNLDVWSKVKFRPRQLSDVSRLNATLATTFLGYKFAAPIFIAPAARAGYGDPARGELNFVDAVAAENILYTTALYASKTIEEIGAQKRLHNATLNGPMVTFQQIYSNVNLSVTWDQIARAERAGAKAIVFTIDAPSNSVRHRAARYDTTNANSVTSALTWALYDQIRNRTSLPVIPKGISTVEDALMAVDRGAPAIYISNHGGRQLDHSPSPLEIAYEIHRNAPDVFRRVEVMADSGVRYGSDVLKLLALGVKMVGMGRPFMYANCYGLAGVTKLIQMMKEEIVYDGAQLGVTDLRNVSRALINPRALDDTVFLMN